MASYWVVDPERPAISVWALTDGRYGEPRVVLGDDELVADVPYPVAVTPSRLVERL